MTSPAVPSNHPSPGANATERILNHPGLYRPAAPPAEHPSGLSMSMTWHRRLSQLSSVHVPNAQHHETGLKRLLFQASVKFLNALQSSQWSTTYEILLSAPLI